MMFEVYRTFFIVNLFLFNVVLSTSSDNDSRATSLKEYSQSNQCYHTQKDTIQNFDQSQTDIAVEDEHEVLVGFSKVQPNDFEQSSFGLSTDYSLWKLCYDYFALRECKLGTVYSHEAAGTEWQLIFTPNYFNCDPSCFPTIDDIECALHVLLNSSDYDRKLAFCIRLYNDDRSFTDVRIQRAETPPYRQITTMNCKRGYERKFPEQCGVFNGRDYFSLDKYFSNDNQTKSSEA
ncbi:hypothetical protein KDRO_E09690 [Kluyveromyces lactis]|nr:hypothetical protein KDRO_E09690 [Kluyveromyces lactis]